MRVVGQLRHARLAVVVDSDAERANAAARASGTRAVTALDEIIGEIDAAIVAVPTSLHVPTAVQLAEAGVHMLVEKPLAPTVEESQLIIDAAARAGLVLAVGHIERFNAAVVELPRLLDDPIHIEASRISPYSPRVADGVIFDLMIHDIDIVCSLAGEGAEPIRVTGVAHAIRERPRISRA